MKNIVGEKISRIRKSKGLSQEELADKANINLRTVQRIENGETEPRGHTLSCICKVLDINIENLVDYGKSENKSFFIYFHASVIAGLVIPFGDIIVPLILWLSKKDKIINLDVQGKNLLIFRACLDVLLYVILTVLIILLLRNPNQMGENLGIVFGGYMVIYFLANLVYPVYVAISISRSKTLKSYYPQFVKA